MTLVIQREIDSVEVSLLQENVGVCGYIVCDIESAMKPTLFVWFS